MIKILTFYYRSYNYGGTLQAYALCNFLYRNGLQSEQLCYQSTVARKPLLEKLKTTNFKKILVTLRNKVRKVLFNFLVKEGERRKRNFEKFQDLKIPHSNCIYSDKDIALSVKKGDIFIVGSDQVWNPAWTNGRYFLDFVPDNCRKIAYAASFGVDKKNMQLYQEKINLLKRFDFVSVREENVVEVLEKKIKKRVDLVSDPTILLTKEQWDEVSVSPIITEKYIFVYLLGNNKNHRDIVRKVSSILNLKVVFIPHIHFFYNPSDSCLSDFTVDNAGPMEFLGLIKNAEIVITDSFHGSVFSIINEKNFWVLRRHTNTDPQNMSSRLDTLFTELGVPSRYIDEDTILSREFLKQKLDYIKVNKSLAKFRARSAKFLLDSIKFCTSK